MAHDENLQDHNSEAPRQPYVTPELEQHDEWDLVTGIDVSFRA